MLREKLLDPTGGGDQATDVTLAPRLPSLQGLTVALLGNGKANAAALLEAVSDELKRTHGVREAIPYTKGYFGTPVEQSLIQKILHNSDFAVAGIGD